MHDETLMDEPDYAPSPADRGDAPADRRPPPRPRPAAPSDESRRLTMTFYAAMIGGRPEIDPTLPSHAGPGGSSRSLARRVRRACQAVAGEGTSERLTLATTAAVRNLDRARRAVAAML